MTAEQYEQDLIVLRADLDDSRKYLADCLEEERDDVLADIAFTLAVIRATKAAQRTAPSI